MLTNNSYPSPNHSSRSDVRVDVLVLHHTATRRGAPALRTLTDDAVPPERRVSAHYLVDTDGTVYCLVAESRKAWHAGVSTLRGESRPSVNARSIGIEIVNPGDNVTPFTEAQYQALEQLVPEIVLRHRIPTENVLGHRDVAPGRKTDPADNFNWARVRAAVERAQRSVA
ncbi:N-acetylmuramoyl-L-alanine amidase [Archangium lansingense]|uniref:N-acetylmuramoyl-L-alanine amidase n=1 Tax=Archangium lansingense TaxID=2995310 RepID=A0ABT4AF44_9BACT|nr:N-acetylmuramoyl-L-alanine amidase [Archangium lansinium]MCY1080293.1 N-acetylmuramoyl-L-alanine amidase [Archangium lansinium]